MYTNPLSVLEGLTIKSIEGMKVDSDEIIFVTECGKTFKMYHEQDCCESVWLQDVYGDPVYVYNWEDADANDLVEYVKFKSKENENASE